MEVENGIPVFAKDSSAIFEACDMPESSARISNSTGFSSD
jgi:hypothetical protein